MWVAFLRKQMKNQALQQLRHIEKDHHLQQNVQEIVVVVKFVQKCGSRLLFSRFLQLSKEVLPQEFFKQLSSKMHQQHPIVREKFRSFAIFRRRRLPWEKTRQSLRQVMITAKTRKCIFRLPNFFHQMCNSLWQFK